MSDRGNSGNLHDLSLQSIKNKINNFNICNNKGNLHILLKNRKIFLQ